MKLFSKDRILPLSIFIAGTILAVAAGQFVRSSLHKQDQERFKGLSSKVPAEVQNRFEKALMGVRSVSAFIQSHDYNFNISNFRKFIHARDVQAEFAGILGLGWITPVSLSEYPTLEKRLIKEYAPNEYKVKSTFQNHDLFVINYVEPTSLNQKAQGFDVGQEIERRRAAEHARDTGYPTVTNKITLIQDERKEPGFLVYHPVYRSEKKLYTYEERRALFLGWAYAPVVMSRIVQPLRDPIYANLEIHIFSSRSKKFENVLYDSGHHATLIPLEYKQEFDEEFKDGEWESEEYRKDFLIKTAENEWLVNVRATHGFYTPYVDLLGYGVAAIGIAIAALVSLLFRQSFLTQKKAEGIAERMTSVYIEKNRELVSTMKQLEETRANAAHAARLSALGEMSGQMAHEINNPMTIISSKAELCLKLLATDPQPEKLRAHLERIVSTVVRVSKIIKALRTIAREGTKDDFELVPAQTLIDESLELCEARIRNRSVELEVTNLAGTTEVPVRHVQFMQVLINLLNNSVDAIEANEQKWIKIKTEVTPDLFTLRLMDSGKGIPPEIAAKIMEPFYTTKEVGKGTGLGLSISKSIIESHGGRFWLDQNCPNTCFVIEIPRQQVADSPTKAAA